MEHRDAPEGKALKYARAEWERRFLLGQAQDDPCLRRAAITDLYVTGTRLRLRRAGEWNLIVSQNPTNGLRSSSDGQKKRAGRRAAWSFSAASGSQTSQA
jgi:hypothetical protein